MTYYNYQKENVHLFGRKLCCACAFFITHSFIHMGVVFRDKTMGLYFFNKVNS